MLKCVFQPAARDLHCFTLVKGTDPSLGSGTSRRMPDSRKLREEPMTIQKDSRRYRLGVARAEGGKYESGPANECRTDEGRANAGERG